MKINENILEVIEELRALSNQNIDNYLRVNVPTIFRTFSCIRKESFYDTHRILQGKFSLQDSTLLLSYDIPFSTYQNKTSYMERLDILVKNNYVYPFLFFVNGEFIKWSDIYIVKDCKYSYILLANHYVDGKFEMVTLPKNVIYNELSKINNNTLFAFKDGKFYNGGDNCITIDNKGFDYYYYEEIKLKSDRIQHFAINPIYEMCEDNIIVFRNGLLYTDNFEYYNLNMFSVDGNELDGEYYAKGFYYYKSNERQNNHEVIMRKDKVIENTINLNSVPNYFSIFKNKFNFSFSFKNTYEKNIMNALNYIMLYNSGLMNRYYKKVNKTRTRIYNGKELKALVKNGYITMSRRMNGNINNYVMIFHNGELYKHYKELRYINKDFIFPFKDIKDEDTIEFLYFMDVDNREFPIVLSSKREDTYYIDDSVDILHTKLFTIQPEKLDFNIEISPHKQYEIGFSYDFNNDDTTIIIPDCPFYYDKRLHLVSERQFKYYYKQAKYRMVDVILPPEDFKYCNNPKQYMVFINGRKLNCKNYKVIVPTVDTPFDDNSIYFNIPLEEDDYIEIFYVPDILYEVQSDMKLSSNGNIYLDKTKLKHNLSKDLNFIFVNGKKVPRDYIYDISQTLIKITTDIETVNNLCVIQHIEEDNLLSNIFVYNTDKITKIVDSLTENEFNILFENTNITNKESTITSGAIPMKVLIYSIIKDYYCAPYTNIGETFAFNNIDECFNDYDPDGNLILDWFEANRENKPLKGRDDE